jgi:hypothetical protein
VIAARPAMATQKEGALRTTFGRSAWLCAVSAWSFLLTPACGQMQVTADHPALKYDWNQKPGKPIAVRPGSITCRYVGRGAAG